MLRIMTILALLLSSSWDWCTTSDIVRASPMAGVSSYVPLASSLMGAAIGYSCGHYMRNLLYREQKEASFNSKQSSVHKKALAQANNQLSTAQQGCDAAISSLDKAGTVINSVHFNSADLQAMCDNIMAEITWNQFTYDCPGWWNKFQSICNKYKKMSIRNKDYSKIAQLKHNIEQQISSTQEEIQRAHEEWDSFKQCLKNASYQACENQADRVKQAAEVIARHYQKRTPGKYWRVCREPAVVRTRDRFVKNVDCLLECKRDQEDRLKRVSGYIEQARASIAPLNFNHVSKQRMSTSRPAETWFGRLLPHGLAMCTALAGYGIAALFGYA